SARGRVVLSHGCAWFSARGRKLAQARQYLLLIGREERVLLGPDLLDVDLVKPRPGEGIDRFEMALEVGAAGDLLGDLLGGHQLAGLLDVPGCGQHLREFTRKDLVRPYP